MDDFDPRERPDQELDNYEYAVPIPGKEEPQIIVGLNHLGQRVVITDFPSGVRTYSVLGKHIMTERMNFDKTMSQEWKDGEKWDLITIVL